MVPTDPWARAHTHTPIIHTHNVNCRYRTTPMIIKRLIYEI